MGLPEVVEEELKQQGHLEVVFLALRGEEGMQAPQGQGEGSETLQVEEGRALQEEQLPLVEVMVVQGG